MSTFQSVQSAGNNGDSLTITKPTSLAVGDLLLAGIYSSNGTGAGSVSINTPSGWTQVAIDGIASSNDMIACFSKVADSSDVAASNFTFTDTNGQPDSFMIGQLARITNFGLVDASNTNENNTASSVVISTITPDYANCLFVIFAGGTNGGAGGPSIDTYALATNNPTWTEQAQTSQTSAGGRGGTLSIATATRPETTATGNITVTYGASTNRLGAIVVALAPRIDGSVTPTTQVYANAFTPVFPVTVIATMDSPTTDVSNPAVWSNQSKNNSTWTPQDKP